MRLLSKSRTKTYGEILDMLFDLRAMGLDIENEGGGGPLLVRALSFKPFCYAVAINISAFFLQASFKDSCRIRALTENWFSREDGHTMTFIEFKRKLSKLAQQWMQKGKHHPAGLIIAGKHLLNVVTLWPKAISRQST